jgi:hypothetical protein
MPLLHPGDSFPELTLTVPGGQTVKVPEAFAGQFGVLLFYRDRGAPTATPSYAPSSAPAASWQTPGPGSPPCRSMTRPPPPP